MNAIKLTMLVSAILGTLATATAADTSAPRSRAEVVAELHAARAAGLLGVMEGEDSGSFWLASQAAASTLTRAQVSADARSARERGEIAAFGGEDSGSFWLASQQPSTRLTRTEVLAEMFAANARGEITGMTGEDSGSEYLAQRAAQATMLARSAPGPAAAVTQSSTPVALLMRGTGPAQACPAPHDAAVFTAQVQ